MKEKQAIAEMRLQDVERKISQYTGKTTKIVIDSTTFSRDMQAINNVNEKALIAMTDGFHLLCKDSKNDIMLKDMNVKKIVLKNGRAVPVIHFRGTQLIVTYPFSSGEDLFDYLAFRDELEFILHSYAVAWKRVFR